MISSIFSHKLRFLAHGSLGLILAIGLGCASVSTSSGVRLPTYSETTLDNGLKILIVEDHSLPYISVGMLVKSGGSEDPLGKSGLSELTASLLERGSKNRTATQIADDFGQLGTGFGADSDYDYTYLSTSGLSTNQDELLTLFFEVATQPSFSVGEVDRLRAETVAEIKRGYDQPGHVASELYARLLFGTHPYARSVEGTVRDVQSIKQKDVIRYYLKGYRPNNSWLVLVGDLQGDIKKIIAAKTASWQSRPSEEEKLPALQPIQGRRIQLVNRPDLKQSEVRMGHYGIKRKVDDYQALSVAETILGDGFTSRLMQEIRVKRGLTYGISSGFDPRKEVGPYTIAAGTRHAKVGELVRETLQLFEAFHKSGVTDKEVAAAKGYLRGSFPRRIETPGQLARMLVAMRFYGIDDDYLADYIKNLDRLSADDVNRVIKKYYDPENMRILVYGPGDQIIDQLRPIGTVEVKNYRELL